MMKTTLAVIGLVSFLGAAQFDNDLAAQSKTELPAQSKPESTPTPKPRIQIIVKGRVLDEAGKPVAMAYVAANPMGTLKGVLPTAWSDAQGEFSVEVHQTGQFFMSAHKTADGYPRTSNAFYYPYPSEAALINVLADQSTPFVTVQFGPKAGRISMRVLDAETSEPLGTLSISLCRIEAPRYCDRFTSGAVRNVHSVLAPSFPFTLEVSAAGYESAYGESGREAEFKPLQVQSGTIKEMTIAMRKGTDNGANKLPAPKIVSPADRTVLMNVAHPRMLTVEWEAVPGAVSYSVEAEVCAPGAPDGDECKQPTQSITSWRNPPPSGIEGTKYEFMFPGTQPGRWRVWAVDERGRPGVKTPWTLFFYRWKE